MKYDTSWLLGLVVNLSIAADLSLWPGSSRDPGTFIRESWVKMH